MALAKLTDGIVSMRGRFGGVYFHSDRTGQHIAAMPRIIRSPTRMSPTSSDPLQATTRGLLIAAFTKMAQYWKLITELLIIGYWLNFATQNLFTRKDGTKIVLCPRNWFCHYNVRRIYLEKNVWFYPPQSNWNLPPYYAAGTAFGAYGNPLYEVGTYGGKPLYKFAVGVLLLWWDGDMWWATSAPGYKPENYAWFRWSENPEGIYEPMNPLDEEINITS